MTLATKLWGTADDLLKTAYFVEHRSLGIDGHH
jgi:hypothetical protein